ncbi:transposase [Klebsiella pneumoniae]|nr:transposase [Klebsiella pneumoniae]
MRSITLCNGHSDVNSPAVKHHCPHVTSVLMRSPSKKGHQYVTVISDTQGQALELRDDRGVESLAGYLRNLGDRQVESIKTLSMDMNPAYISAARVHLPNAVEKIAFDHFHVAKMLCAVVDKTRQSEMKTIPLQARKKRTSLPLPVVVWP